MAISGFDIFKQNWILRRVVQTHITLFSVLSTTEIIAESTTFALRIENVDITGFDGL
jgi:hypothetical protein